MFTVLLRKQLFQTFLPMQSDIWEMDCLDVNRGWNQKMDCILKKSSRKLCLLYELGFLAMNFDTIDPRFMHPFTAIIAGPSQSGKSMFCMRLISNARECIAPPPERIVYCYSVYQPLFDRYPNVEFVEGLPDLNMFDGDKRTLLIIDDLMQETNETVSKLFTRVSHHKNVSVIYLTQNLFNNNKHNRTISL